MFECKHTDVDCPSEADRYSSSIIYAFGTTFRAGSPVQFLTLEKGAWFIAPTPRRETKPKEKTVQITRDKVKSVCITREYQ